MDCEDKVERKSLKCWLQRLFAGGGVIFVIMLAGMDGAQSSVMLPQLEKADSIIRVTPNEESWIASLGIMMAPVSALLIGPFIDTFGRKRGLQMFYFITALGYAVMACAREVYHLYIGRVICGLALGVVSSAVVYLVEVYTIKQREYLLSASPAVGSCGGTLMTIVGGYLPWNLAALIFSATAFILLITQLFIPESPAWLFKMGQEDASVRSLQTLGRSEAEIKEELHHLQLQCKDDMEKIELQTFLEPTVWKPFLIMVIFMLLISGTGLNSLMFYTVDFIERLGTRYDALNVAVMLATTRLITSSTLAIIFKARASRRFAVGFSTFWMAVAFAGLGVYELVYRNVTTAERPSQWLCVASLLLYSTTCVLGLIGIPLMMSSEMYPLRVRGTLAGVTQVVGCGIAFVSIQIYHVCVETLQIYGLILLFAGFSFAGLLFAVFVLPETKDKSLYEIQQSFMPKEKPQPKSIEP